MMLALPEGKLASFPHHLITSHGPIPSGLFHRLLKSSWILRNDLWWWEILFNCVLHENYLHTFPNFSSKNLLDTPWFLCFKDWWQSDPFAFPILCLTAQASLRHLAPWPFPQASVLDWWALLCPKSILKHRSFATFSNFSFPACDSLPF